MELALICMKQVFSMFLMILAGFVLTRAGIVVVSTIFSIITLPVCCYLLTRFL